MQNGSTLNVADQGPERCSVHSKAMHRYIYIYIFRWFWACFESKQAENTSGIFFVRLGPRTVRGRRGREGAQIRAGCGTDRGSVRPKSRQPYIVQDFDGGDNGDGAVHVFRDLSDKKVGARTQSSHALVAEGVGYPDGSACVSRDNRAEKTVGTAIVVFGPSSHSWKAWKWKRPACKWYNEILQCFQRPYIRSTFHSCRETSHPVKEVIHPEFAPGDPNV